MATLRGVLAGVFAAAFAIFTLAGAVSAADEALFVRERGDLKRLVIHGAKTFSEAEIKEALAVDIDVAVAARPDAPLVTLCKTLSEKTLVGYLFNGFADAKIQVVFDPAANKLVMTIEGGPRYLAGQVVVEGLDASLADRIREALTVEKPPASNAPAAPQPQPGAAAQPKKKVVWSIGEPARLDGESQNRVREKIDSALNDCGLLFSQFTLERVPDRNANSVELKILCTDPGTPAKIDELSVLGNEKQSREEILKFVDLSEGAIWTGDMSQRLERRLKQSGRFTKAKVRAKRPSQPGEKLWGYVEVAEYAKAPPLSQPLSREEEALVRLSQWLADFPARQEDVVLTTKADEYEFDIVFSPQFGVLVLVRQRSPVDADEKHPASLKWAFVTSDERIGFYSAPRGRKLVAIPTPTPVVANAAISLHDGPPKLTGQGEFMFGLGMAGSGKRSRRRHCEFRFNDSAVELLSLAHEYGSKLSWDSDVLTVKYKEKSLKLDGKTGRLIEFTDANEEGDMRMTVAPGQFERKLAELDAATRDLPNLAAENAERPLSSVLEFLADEALALEGFDELKEHRPELRLVRKLVSQGLLKPLDRLGVAACQRSPEKDSFSIPCEYVHFSLSDGDFRGDWLHDPHFQKMLCGLTLHWGLWLEDSLLSANGWPREVWREAIYAQAERSNPADRAVDLTKLCASPDAGPLCCLSAAAAATEWQFGAPAALFANLGKTKLTLAELQNDYRPLLDANSFVGEYLLCLADVLRGLEADEVETLSAMFKSYGCLDQRSLDALSAVAAVLRQHREEPVDQALAASLDQLWQLGLRNQVAMLLDELASETPPSIAPPPLDVPQTAGYGAYQGAPYGEYPASGEYQAGTYGTAYPATPGEPAAGYYGAAAEAAPDPSRDMILEMMTRSPKLALDGYCPVTLVEKRTWRKGDADNDVMHAGQAFFLAGTIERERFLKHPERYAPVMCGSDVVQLLAEQSRMTPGKREFGVFYRDQIWLFESEESRRKFKEIPEKYMEFFNGGRENDDAAPPDHPAAAESSKCEDLPSVTAEESPADDSAAREHKYRHGEVTEGFAGGSPEKAANAHLEASLFAVVIFPEPGPNDAPPPRPAPGQPPPALGGYSPVTLVELQKWRAGDPRYVAAHRGRVYFCASEFERQAFLKDPDRYAIANDGLDIVEQIDHQRETPGKPEFAAYWNQQLLLFASRASRDLFERNWKYHVVRHSALSVENLGRGDRYANRPGVSEAINTNSAELSETAVQKKPARVGRRRAFGRRFR